MSGPALEMREAAKSLTKTQRAVLLAGSVRPKKWRSIMRDAKRNGHVGRRLDFFVRETEHSLNSFRLRPFGIAVRAAILEEGA